LSTPTAEIHVPASWGRAARCFRFGDACATWQAETPAEVPESLARVEEAQEKGLYVVGVLRYEAGLAFDRACVTLWDGLAPLGWFAAYRAALPNAETSPPAATPAVACAARESREHYLRGVARIIEHIRAGDVYQVNHTIRADVALAGADPYQLFLWLCERHPVPHAAFMRGGPASVVSISPELFMRRRGNMLESRPMKGTAARVASREKDGEARERLGRDEKDRAENLMIVDLVRNDLGRVCETGSIQVPRLWTVESYRTVHQMTSTVRGRLRQETRLADIFRALFPAGSVTGAPKVRAMQIIAACEREARGAYCGTLGLFFPGGDFECSVLIRTIEIPHEHEYGTLGLGAGIVADSDPEQEWRETQLKGRFLGVV
jgi:aminodeoxychorismate synthase component I